MMTIDRVKHACLGRKPMKNINRNMLHMKLNSAVSVFSIAAAFSVFLPPPAYSGICFLPDCDEKSIDFPDMNIDTKYCEDKGYTYYPTGECPQYYAKVGECNRDDHYLKCDAKTWCEQNGYNVTSCSIPKYVDQPCPSYGSLYKQCKTDNDRACKELGYTKTCPSGQKLKKNSGRCAYDSSYGTCCTPTGCPSYTSLTSSSYGTNGTDGCEYTCYYTCNMNCPSGTSTSNPGGCGGSTKNGCGTKTCYYPYKACCTPSCSDTTSYCSCGSYYISDGCGGSCKRCESCCTHSSHVSCSNGCETYCPCCSSCKTCKSANPCPPGYTYEGTNNYWGHACWKFFENVHSTYSYEYCIENFGSTGPCNVRTGECEPC